MADETVKVLLEKALRRRRELQFELETLQRLIDGYRRLRVLQDENPHAEQLHLWHGASRRAQKSEELVALLEEVRRIILKEGRPLTRSELVDHLERLGYRIPGTDPRKVLGTNIWRSGKFNHIEGKGYWPKEADLPPHLI
ncbi:MAG: hypothetical protein WBR13_12735 [Allosphingosinicella sp.]